MIDGFLLGVFGTLVSVGIGLLIAEFYHARQNTRDGQWSNMLQQQQRQIDDLLEYIADHSDGDEVSAEELGYE